MEWEFRATDATAALAARRAFDGFLRASCKKAESDYESAVIAFSELVANVVQHAPGPIYITLRSDARGHVTLEVFDTGREFTLAPALPPVSSESGRGLYLVSRLCSRVSATRTHEGNRISVVLPVEANPSALHLVESAYGKPQSIESKRAKH
jgi:anti-sigma regulatory factor (Ser/Thr protein kinase)